ncbi:serine/threonine protein kinase [Planctomycetota bacterium]
MANIIKVRADSSGKGYGAFLASSIAWHEVVNHRSIVPLRRKLAALKRKLQDLLTQKDQLRSNGRHATAEMLQGLTDDRQTKILNLARIVSKRENLFIKKRQHQIRKIDPDRLLAFLRKSGLPWPQDGVFVLKEFRQDRSDPVRLYGEFKCLKLLEHSNILTVYTYGRHYYVMEFNQDLATPNRWFAPLAIKADSGSDAERLRVAIETAKALEHAHFNGFVNRDVKPDNIVMDARGQVKLLDFGLVKSTETKEATQANEILGTPFYMSPEQIRDTRDARFSFDIYSLGATLYHFVTGRLPFEEARHTQSGRDSRARGTYEVFRLVCHDKYVPVPPSDYRPGLNPLLERVILKAMQKNPLKRYPTMTAFREDMERCYGEMGGRPAAG